MKITNKQNTFVVPVTYQSWGTVEIEADTMEELLEKLKDKGFVDKMALPLEPEYVDDSYIIDFEGIDSLN